MLDRWLSYTVTIAWEFGWAGAALVVLDRWMFIEVVISTGLTVYIYINYNLNPIKKLTSSSRSTKSKNILRWNISQMILKTIPISMKIVINYVMKRSILFWVYWKLMETETTIWSEFPKGGKAIAEQILASEEINSKDQDCEMQSGIRVGKLNFWVRSFKIIQSLPDQPVPPDWLASPYDGH